MANKAIFAFITCTQNSSISHICKQMYKNGLKGLSLNTMRVHCDGQGKEYNENEDVG